MVRKGSTRNKHAKNRQTSRSEPRDGSPRVVKFFKVMFAKNYWRVMYLPPLFAESVKHLEGQETEIEDLNGNRWPVEYSYVDGALAFEKGWSRFYIDHRLKIGHFVKFNYVNESHFVVEIFDESAMEITDFNSVGPQSNKRMKRNQEIVCIGDQSPQSAAANLQETSSSADSVASQSEFQDFQMQPNVIGGLISMGMDNPSQNVQVDLMSTSLDDPILLIDTRNNGCYDEGERTNMLYDLSCFEMEGKMGDTNVSEKASGGKTEQIKLIKGGDTQMAEIHSRDISTRQLRARPSKIGNLRKTTHDVVSGSHNDNNELRASGIEPLCVGRNKSDYAVKSKFPESSVSRSLPKSQLGPQHAVKKELLELRAQKHNFPEVHYDKSPIIATRDGVMLLPVVKASGIEHLSVGRNKSAERDYAVKPRCAESSVSRSLPKSSLGPQHAVKKELVELRAQGNIFPEARYDKSPIVATRDGVMLSPVVKASGIEPLSVGRNKSAERDYAVKTRCAESSVSSLVPKKPLGLQLALKKDLVNLRAQDNLFSEGSNDKSSIIATQDGKMFLAVVKAEPDLPIVSLSAISPFTTKVKSQLYLEIPVRIPPATRRKEWRLGEGKVMFLRGPNGRLIPVLYPEMFKVKALTGNWNLFCEKNGLQPGDECRFEVEDENKCLYRVDVIRSIGW